ncbi:hypothetical protein Cri9333_4444 [Crinalium epipsammum PCC 9333]|uniref:Uncharacterized protein n=1 Tax=Crinalium epipsammum PCC 9333 TaxID=1173022 RepID=K9W651_9CYAN|nr:hypothetical protein [Crinalium epipsammum]AFZ15227.1 hypothetical protein Cri9333_4444 [Crinalium epipsammum PCC 9333]
MSKLIYDVMQRFEVENGVPHLVSTNIQVIQGGEDLLSLATSLLAKLGFYEKFEENRTSQYIGFRLKKPGKGTKRYQLVLAQRKEGLCISVPQNIAKPYILEIFRVVDAPIKYEFDLGEAEITEARLWVLPSKEDLFLEAIKSSYGSTAIRLLKGEVVGRLGAHPFEYEDQFDNGQTFIGIDYGGNEFKFEQLGSSDNYLILMEDKLFPYTWQVCITSSEVLNEFLAYFAKILMEQ